MCAFQKLNQCFIKPTTIYQINALLNSKVCGRRQGALKYDRP